AFWARCEGALFRPGTISPAFHGGSIAAIFYPLSLTAFEATPLILTGLSVAVCFRAGMFNIGAAGQWIGGALVATWLGYAINLPIVLHAVVCIIGAFIGGAAIGWDGGEIKARAGAPGGILTIKLHYVMDHPPTLLPSHPAVVHAGAGSDQRGRSEHRRKCDAATCRRATTAGRRRVPDRDSRRGSDMVAALPQHDGL